MRPTLNTDNLPVTVIPAPTRPGAALAQLREEDELEANQALPRDRSNSATSQTSRPNGTDSPSVPQVYRLNTTGSSGTTLRASPNPQGMLGARNQPGVVVIPAPARRDTDPTPQENVSRAGQSGSSK